MSVARTEPGRAERDECCKWCGYPFDTGEAIRRASADSWNEGRGYCGRKCADLDLAHEQARRLKASLAEGGAS